MHAFHIKKCYAPLPNYLLKSKLSIMLHYQLFSTRYATIRIKNCLKSTSIIKVASMKSTDDFCYAEESIMCYHQIDTFHCHQRWMEHRKMHCTYCDMPKCTSLCSIHLWWQWKDEWNTGKSMKNVVVCGVALRLIHALTGTSQLLHQPTITLVRQVGAIFATIVHFVIKAWNSNSEKKSSL